MKMTTMKISVTNDILYWTDSTYETVGYADSERYFSWEQYYLSERNIQRIVEQLPKNMLPYIDF